MFHFTVTKRLLESSCWMFKFYVIIHGWTTDIRKSNAVHIQVYRLYSPLFHLGALNDDLVLTVFTVPNTKWQYYTMAVLLTERFPICIVAFETIRIEKPLQHHPLCLRWTKTEVFYHTCIVGNVKGALVKWSIVPFCVPHRMGLVKVWWSLNVCVIYVLASLPVDLWGMFYVSSVLQALLQLRLSGLALYLVGWGGGFIQALKVGKSCSDMTCQSQFRGEIWLCVHSFVSKLNLSM